MATPEILRAAVQFPDLLGELAKRTKGDPKVLVELSLLKFGTSDMARCVRAGLYVRYNFLNESHTISQAIHTPEGSYWHAIMHRREPDYSNAMYWYHSVGHHPVFDELSRQEVVLKALGATKFDPFEFVNLCEAAATDKSKFDAAVVVQRAEWQALFEHCVKGAGIR